MISLHYYFNNSHESIRVRLTRGISWNFVNSLFTQGTVFLTNVVIANILGRQIFGEFGIIQNTVLFFASLGQMAIGLTATKYIAEFRSSDPARTGRILGLCSRISFLAALIVALIAVLSASRLASAILNAPHLTLGLILSSGIIFFSIITGFQTGALAGLEGYRRLGRAAMIQAFFYLVVCGLFAFLWRLEGALVGLAISLGLRWFIFDRALKKEIASQQISFDFSNWWKEKAILKKFAVPSAVIVFFSMSSLWVTNLFLVRQPDGYSQMGLFTAAYNLRTMIIFLPNLMNNVGISLLNNQKGKENIKEYKNIFWTNMILTQSVALVVSLIVILLGPWLLRAFGKEFPEGYTVLLLLVVSALAEILSTATYQVIQSQEKMWLSFFRINIPWCIAFIASGYIFIPAHLAAGLAWAYLTAWCVHAAITGYQAWRIGPWHAGSGA
jgi:O-antigen/teichoic acid export membrane protein